jgi:ribosome-associated protein
MADRWLRVTSSYRLPLEELVWHVSRSGGPGGQHANTSATRVEVHFPIASAPSLGPRQRARLLARLGPLAKAVAADTRSQARNRELALERLRVRLAEGLRVEPRRHPTRPTRAARSARLDTKRRRSDVKRARGRLRPDDD